jgi:hypothetical protein
MHAACSVPTRGSLDPLEGHEGKLASALAILQVLACTASSRRMFSINRLLM